MRCSASTSTRTRWRCCAAGRAWFLEPDLDDLLARHVKTGRLGFTTSFEEAARFGTVHFLGVGTPGLPDHSGYDLSRSSAPSPRSPRT